MRKKKVKAFVTIEYSLLLPVLLVLFTFLVCTGVYLHNQCVLQTNIYLLAVKGARAEEEDVKERITYLREQEKLLYKNKYLLAEDIQTNYSAQGNKLVIDGSGQMMNPFFVFGMGKEMWQLSAESTVWVFDPEDTLRLMKSACELLEDLPLKEDEADGV